MINAFRYLGRFEAMSFLLLLCVAMPLKYYADYPVGVRIMGPIHGGLFVIYCFMAFWLAIDHEWPGSKHMMAYVAAIIPFGTFLFEHRYLKKEDVRDTHFSGAIDGK